MVDSGPYSNIPEVEYDEPEDAKEIAAVRVAKFKDEIMDCNPHGNKKQLDEALRAALTLMLTGSQVTPPTGTDKALRYIRDRVSVPRDMPIYSARHFRTALETTAAMVSDVIYSHSELKQRRLEMSKEKQYLCDTEKTKVQSPLQIESKNKNYSNP